MSKVSADASVTGFRCPTPDEACCVCGQVIDPAAGRELFPVSGSGTVKNDP